MSPQLLLAALGGMSVFVAVESVWVQRRILPPKYRQWLDFLPVQRTLLALYAVGLPYFALLSGLLPARFLGLRGWDILAAAFSPRPLSQFVPQALLGLGNTLYLWLPDFGAIITVTAILGGVLLVFLALNRTETLSPAVSEPSAFTALLDVVHWGFYRAILWRLGGNLYFAVVGGILLMTLEWVAVARAGKFSPAETKRLALRFGLGLVSSIAFIFAPNLWLAGLAQWALWWSVHLVVHLTSSELRIANE